jgi:hypothetical protein
MISSERIESVASVPAVTEVYEGVQADPLGRFFGAFVR